MTDIPNVHNIHCHAHNLYTCRANERISFYEFCDFPIRNIDFQRSNGGFMSSEIYNNFTFVLSGIYLIRKCDKGGIKAVYNYKNTDYVTTRGR